MLKKQNFNHSPFSIKDIERMLKGYIVSSEVISGALSSFPLGSEKHVEIALCTLKINYYITKYILSNKPSLEDGYIEKHKTILSTISDLESDNHSSAA